MRKANPPLDGQAVGFSSYPCAFSVVDVVVVVVAGDVDLLLLQMSLAPEQRQK